MKLVNKLLYRLILSVSLAIIWIGLPYDIVFAATNVEIIAQANETYRTGKYLDQALKKALEVAQESDIAFEAIAAPLAESLMRTGLEMGQDGVMLAGEICGSIDRNLVSMGVDRAERLRTISQAILGIRASAADKNLNATRVRNQIEIAWTSGAQTKDEADEMMRVIAGTFERPLAEVYTPPAEAFTPPPVTTAPAPPPAPPADITDAYDATASAS
jgi:hypothetical protein